MTDTTPTPKPVKLSEKIRQRLREEQETGNAPALAVVEETGGLFKINAGELREICKDHHTDHTETAAAFLKSVRGMPDEKVVAVPRLDLQAMLEGGTVKRNTSTVDGQTVVTKEYDPNLKPTPPAKPQQKAPTSPTTGGGTDTSKTPPTGKK